MNTWPGRLPFWGSLIGMNGTWTTSSPLSHNNFNEAPMVYRGPYDDNLPGARHDFVLPSER